MHTYLITQVQRVEHQLRKVDASVQTNILN